MMGDQYFPYKFPEIGPRRFANPGLAGGGAALPVFVDVVGTVLSGKAATIASDGNNLMDDTDSGEFTTTVADWTGLATITQEDASVLGINPSGGTDEKIMKLVNVGGSSSATTTTIPVVDIGGTYHGTSRAYSPSANTYFKPPRQRFYTGNISDSYVTAEDVWQTLTSGNIIATVADVRHLLYVLGSTAGDIVYYDKTQIFQHIALATTDGFANYQINANIIMPSSGTAPMGLIGRYSDAANYWYWRITPGTAGNDLDLVKVVLGKPTIVASADIDWTAGQKYNVKVSQVSNNSMICQVDGVEKINYTTADSFNSTETITGFRDSAANNFTIASLSVSQLPFEGAEVRGLFINSPSANYTYQRNVSDQSDITIRGRYAGVAPTTVEARFNGGTWTEIDASPSGLAFSGTLSAQAAGQGALEVRASDDTSVNDSISDVGIGDVFILGGQSNSDGRGTNLQSYSHATLNAKKYKTSWVECTDPVGYNSVYGSPWPLLATQIMAATGFPVAFVAYAEGGTSITEWIVTTPRYDTLKHLAWSAGASYRALLWWQGENDVTDGMAEATYNSHLDSLAASIASDLGCKIMPCKLVDMSAYSPGYDEAAINSAISTAWGDNSNVLTGPDFSDITPSVDGIHMKTDAELQTAADRWYTAIATAFGW